MIDFLIKSTASLTILLTCYHLLLEKEKIHQFNRFFLLFGLLFSLVIPFFTIEIIREIPAATTQNTFQVIETPITVVQESTNYWLWFISSVYRNPKGCFLVQPCTLLLQKSHPTQPRIPCG